METDVGYCACSSVSYLPVLAFDPILVLPSHLTPVEVQSIFSAVFKATTTTSYLLHIVVVKQARRNQGRKPRSSSGNLSWHRLPAVSCLLSFSPSLSLPGKTVSCLITIIVGREVLVGRLAVRNAREKTGKRSQESALEEAAWLAPYGVLVTVLADLRNQPPPPPASLY